MGTSTSRRGPTGGKFKTARSDITRMAGQVHETSKDISVSSEDVADDISPRAEQTVGRVGQKLRDGLRDTLNEDRDAFNILSTIEQSGHRLVDVLEDLRTSGVNVLIENDVADPVERQDIFIREFVDRVAGPGGLITDCVMRRAAAHVATKLVTEREEVGHAVRHGSDERISGEIFCWIYALFFADAVSEFLVSIVAEKIKITLPIFYLDPTGMLARWIAEKIVGLIPDPCQEQEDAVDGIKSAYNQISTLGEIAHGLVETATAVSLNIGDLEAS